MEPKEPNDLILHNFTDQTHVRPVNQHNSIVRLPFHDTQGDPVEISVHIDGDLATICDAGSTAGLLFYLGQHEQGHPAFTLLQKLAQTHRLEIDFDQGLVSLTVERRNIHEGIAEGIAELARIIITVQTAAPHLRPASTQPTHG